MRQLLLDLMPAARPTFDNFVVGGNAELIAGFNGWLSERSQEPLFYMWGETGSGRTHLLRASGAEYLDAAADPALAAWPDDVPFVAVDNVDALDAAGEQALFNGFNRLKAEGGKLLVAAHQPPAAVGLREDLRTRLGSGLIYRAQVLSDAEKGAAIAAQAAARGLALPEGAVDYLLRHAPRDMGSLAAIVVALDRFSLERKRPITLPLLREVLHST